MKIADKLFAVSGGASGLGRATADMIVENGGRVAIFDPNESAGAEAEKELGEQSLYIPVDVSKEDIVEAALEQASHKLGQLYGCISCAGIAVAQKTLSGRGPHDIAAFRKVVDVNLAGTFNMMRLGAARMMNNDPDESGDRGVLINTASIAAYDGQKGQAAYAASKAAIVGLTLPVARDLAQYAIRVMTIAPGTFETPLLAALPQEALDGLAAAVPHPSRLGQPVEFAQLVQHIINNSMLNGETIRIDGALRMT